VSDFGTLHFLPWMRRGLARSLSQTAVHGAPPGLTGSVRVSVVVGDGSGVGDSAPIEQTMALRGPGDVVGLSANRVARTDPPAGTQDFEPNYFPCVELVPADLPWMFTPAAAGSDDKLVPWLALVVVRADGSTIATKVGAPLRALQVDDAKAELPKLSEAWAWAHVQTASDLTSTDVATAFASEPETFLARLVCPRRLDENTRYVAAIVPTFEEGRRAGLGLTARDAATIDTSDPNWWKAWKDTDEAVELPVYHSWTFKTGPNGDFEQLVRRLTPRELQAGIKDFDIGDAGTPQLPPEPPERKLVSWKGALVSPAAVAIERDEDHWDAFRKDMQTVVNEGLDPGSEPAAGEVYDPLVHDPAVGPPAYAALPAGQDSVPAPVLQGNALRPRHKPLWFGEVNLDPTHRSAAGLGSEVVRRNQEALMASAWQQASALPEINRMLNWTRTAAEVAVLQKATKIEGLSAARTLHVAAAGKRRLRLGDGATVANALAATSLPKGMASAAFARLGRPQGPAGRGMRATASAAIRRER
jgi:hypothetical protein